MTISFPRWVWLWCVSLSLGLCGCVQSNPGSSDEEKEPHFQHGQELANSLDDKGAAESFEKALEVNPHNAHAHFELGLLCQRGDNPDLAAAIYHFERFLRMRPDSDQADAVRARINACKQDFARSVSASLNPVTQAMQRDLEQATADRMRLSTENRELQRQIEALKIDRARLTAAVAQLPPQAADSPESATASARRTVAPSSTAVPAGRLNLNPGVRTYVVQSRETFISISKRFGVSLEALTAANPKIEPRKLRAGQQITIPPK